MKEEGTFTDTEEKIISSRRGIPPDWNPLRNLRFKPDPATKPCRWGNSLQLTMSFVNFETMRPSKPVRRYSFVRQPQRVYLYRMEVNSRDLVD